MKKILIIVLSIIVLQNAFSAVNIEVNISEGPYWNHKIEIVPVIFYKSATPQIAVWVEDIDGNLLETIYLTGKIKEFLKSGKRVEALPVWGAKYMKKENGKFDGVGGATQTKGVIYATELKNQIPDKIRIFAEINNSFDYNEYYTKDGKNNSVNSGVNGQPSMIYMAEADKNSKGRRSLELYGCGSIAGKDGGISKDISKITTAKEITAGIEIYIK